MPKSNWLVAAQALMTGAMVLGKFAGNQLKNKKTKALFKELGYATELYTLFNKQQEATFTANLGKAIQITEEIIQYFNQCSETSHKDREDHQIILTSQIMTLGGYFLELGDLERAEEKLSLALERYTTLEDKQNGYALTIYNLGYLASKKAQKDTTSRQLYLNQSVEKLKEALKELKIIYGSQPTIKNDIYISRSWQLLGLAYQELGEYQNAKATYWEAINWKLARTREKFGEGYTLKFNTLLKSIDYNLDDGAFTVPYFVFMKDWVDILTLLGKLHFDEGDYRNAERLFLKSISTIKVAYEGEVDRLFDVVDSEHPGLNDLYICLSQLSAAKNNPQEALEYLKKSLQISAYEIQLRFAISDENDRLAIVQTQREVLDILLSLVWQYMREDPETLKFALDTVLKRKSLTASAIAAQNEAILSDPYLPLKEKFEQLKSLNQTITHLTYTDRSRTQTRDLQKAQEDFKTLQREFTEAIAESKLEENFKNTCSESVAAALPEKSVLIEIIRFNVYNFTAIPARGDSRIEPARYLAFILPQGRSHEIKMIDLGIADEIDRMSEDMFLSVADGGGSQLDMFDDEEEAGATLAIKEYNPAPARILSRTLLEPILSEIGAAEHIFIAPDSNLNLIPFNILPVDEEGAFLMDSYRISYLSVGRDILSNTRTSVEALSPPLVIADPDFDLEYTGSEEGTLSNLNPNREQIARNIGYRPFHRATGTRILGEIVGEILQVKPYLGKEALESIIYKQQSPKILFIATHGIFLAPPSTSEANLSTGIVRLLSETENPMLRSGLALAGANTFLSGGRLGESQGKGLLLAQDILLHNFFGTEIVFLIACQTGRGDTSTGEGVFGMRRAFAVAGAKTLIMSLWKVPDLESSLLIAKFFEYYSEYNRSNSGSKVEALRKAQEYIRTIRIRELKQSYLGVEILKKLSNSQEDWEQIISGRLDECPLHHTYYWGAWICQGEI